MLTLSQINQYAMDNNIGDNTDLFSILSQMQLEYREVKPQRNAEITSTLSASKIDYSSKTEYSVQDVLDLFNS